MGKLLYEIVRIGLLNYKATKVKLNEEGVPVDELRMKLNNVKQYILVYN